MLMWTLSLLCNATRFHRQRSTVAVRKRQVSGETYYVNMFLNVFWFCTSKR